MSQSKKLFVFVLLIAFVASLPVFANGKGTLSSNQIIHSKYLNYKLQYRVYLPADYKSLSDLPVLYIADGQWYVQRGKVHTLMDKMIAEKKIEPAIAIFLDNRDPDNLQDNRRNRQFFCNQKYIDFVSEELTDEIDQKYKTQAKREGRTILGLSFGGLNSACFGLYGHEAFRGIALQSPAMHPVRSLFADYEKAPKRDLKILLTSGTRSDNEARTRRFRQILEKKGYNIFYKEVPFGHNWDNWKPLLKDVLLYFYRVKS